jgi:hypothetical protein
MKNKQGRSASMITSVVWGVMTGILFMLFGALLGSAFISREVMKYASVSYFAMLLIVIGTVVGGFAAALISKKQILTVTISVGLILLLLLLSTTAIFFGGSFAGVPATAGLVIGCSVATALLSLRVLQRPKTHRKKR